MYIYYATNDMTYMQPHHVCIFKIVVCLKKLQHMQIPVIQPNVLNT